MRKGWPLLTLQLAALCFVAPWGCAVGPRYRAPEAPANAGYAPSALPETTAAAPIAGGEAQRLVAGRDIPLEWWELFQSRALSALIAQALSANPSIRAAQAALRQAKESVYAQEGYFFPSVDAVYQAERHKVAGNDENSETPGVQANGRNLLPYQTASGAPLNAPVYYTFHTAELTVGFVPDLLGGNGRQVEALAAQADAQRFALEAADVTLASNVAAAAIQEASVRAQIRATQDLIQADRESLRILRDQFRLGFAMRIDVAAQEAALAQVETTLPPLEKQLEQTRDLLRALTGNLPNEEVTETFELDGLALPRELPVSLPGKLLAQRPDVRAAEAQLHAANAQVGVAVAAMLPQFSITGSAGGNATEIPWMFRTGGTFWNVFGDVDQPIFHGGTLLHQKRAAQQALRQAAAEYRYTALTAYQNVADTLHATLADAETLAADVTAERAAKATYDLTRRQMQVGYVSYLTLLSAETAYQQALLARIQAQATRLGDAVALFQALGGGWWNRHEVNTR
jgi:NodT family efflux transporter outer membrane factor (OMF) lipoprotein